MSTLILTRSNNTYSHSKLNLHHTWDVSAKPFIPRTNGAPTSAPSSPRVTASASTSISPPEYGRIHQQQQQHSLHPKSVGISMNCAVNPDPVSILFKRAVAQSVHMGSSRSSRGSCDIDDVRNLSSSRHGSLSSSSTSHSSIPSSKAVAAAAGIPSSGQQPSSSSTLHPPCAVSLCEKPAKKTPLMSTTEYFMERWNDKNDITSVTHAVLEKTYLESRKNPATSTVPSLFGRDSPFPPVLINQLPSLMSIWKIPYESESFTAEILGAHPEFAIQVFRHDGKNV
jgi:hypothetical protein